MDIGVDDLWNMGEVTEEHWRSVENKIKKDMLKSETEEVEDTKTNEQVVVNTTQNNENEPVASNQNTNEIVTKTINETVADVANTDVNSNGIEIDGVLYSVDELKELIKNVTTVQTQNPITQSPIPPAQQTVKNAQDDGDDDDLFYNPLETVNDTKADTPPTQTVDENSNKIRENWQLYSRSNPLEATVVMDRLGELPETFKAELISDNDIFNAFIQSNTNKELNKTVNGQNVSEFEALLPLAKKYKALNPNVNWLSCYQQASNDFDKQARVEPQQTISSTDVVANDVISESKIDINRIWETDEDFKKLELKYKDFKF